MARHWKAECRRAKSPTRDGLSGTVLSAAPSPVTLMTWEILFRVIAVFALVSAWVAHVRLDDLEKKL
jgi:hypothetical protein